MITPGATSCSGACPTEAPDLGSIFICFDWELTEEHLASSSSCSLLSKLVTCYVNLAQYPSPCHPSPRTNIGLPVKTFLSRGTICSLIVNKSTALELLSEILENKALLDQAALRLCQKSKQERFSKRVSQVL